MPHYTMIGHQIKYEPAWANKEQKKIMETLNLGGNTRTLAGKILLTFNLKEQV